MSGHTVFSFSHTDFSSGTASSGQFPASLAFSAAWISLASGTYSGSFLERVNSASPRGLERKDDVSLRIDEFFEGLKNMGYTGPVLAEPFVEELGKMKFEEAVAAVSEAVNKVWPKEA